MTLPNLADELQVGQLLMIETRHEILLGNLKHIDNNGKIIELENVRDFKTNYEYTSTQMLPLPQIQTIKIINDDYNDAENTTTATSNSKSSCNEYNASATSSMSPVVEGMRTATATAAPQECAINLSSRELLLIQQQLGNIIYIVQSDQRYHKALADIRTQSVVSLLLEPMSFGRHNKTSLLAVGTASVVYIFDMLSLGKVFRDLREILESKRPRKVLHYSHRIVDNLQHRQSVQLGGIFDTFVAHCLLTGQKKPLDLLDTVQRYFSISAQYFESSDEVLLQPQDAYNRPVSKALLQLLTKKVIFQYKLYEHLLHEQMLTNFYRQCDNFATSFSSNDDAVDVAIQMVPSSRQGFQHIRPQQAWNDVLNKDLENLQLE